MQDSFLSVLPRPAEIEILWGIANGCTHAELAERMNISRNTVPAHIKNINRELAANVRTI